MTTVTTLYLTSSNSSSSKSKPKLIQRMRHKSAPDVKKENQFAEPAFQEHTEKKLNTGPCPRSPIAYEQTKQDGESYTKPEARSTQDVAAYLLQPDGTIATIRWTDKTALEKNSGILTALKHEQEAQRIGQTSGVVKCLSNPRAKLPYKMLDWLTSKEETSDAYTSANDSNAAEKHPRLSRGQSCPRIINQTPKDSICMSPRLANRMQRQKSQHPQNIASSNGILDRPVLPPSGPKRSMSQSYETPSDVGHYGSQTPPKHPWSSGQVQHSYWQPGQSTSLLPANTTINPVMQHGVTGYPSPRTARALHTTASREMGTTFKRLPDTHTANEKFTFYERCAISDF